MANRGRHYEEAFEDFLAAEGIPYVPVTLAQRQAFQAARIKAFDFVVWPSSGPNWLVDIKGRTAAGDRLDNWVTQSDLDGLAAWQSVFGEGFIGVFVFVFQVQKPGQWPYEQAPLYNYRDGWYSFWGTPSDEYCRSVKVRSARWGTWSCEPDVFRCVAEPVGRWLIAEPGESRA